MAAGRGPDAETLAWVNTLAVASEVEYKEGMERGYAGGKWTNLRCSRQMNIRSFGLLGRMSKP